MKLWIRSTFSSVATAVIPDFGFAWSPSLKPSIRLLVYLQGKMALGSGVSLDVTQAPIPNLPLVSCCHPTPSLAQAGCKYISNLHHSCSFMTRAIKKKIEYMNPSESANLSLPPHSALGLRFLGLSPSPPLSWEMWWRRVEWLRLCTNIQSLSNKWISVSSIICLAVAPIICCEL